MNRFFLGWLPSYERASLRNDIVAGLVAAAVVIPQAIAYAAIAGLPLATGLYTALVALVVYALFGTSASLSVTTTSTLAILTAGALETNVPTHDVSAMVRVAATLALLAGVFQISAALLRLGGVADLISEPVLLGFKAGVGVVIITDQAPALLGIHVQKTGFIRDVLAVLAQLGETSIPTLLLSAASLGLLVGLGRWLPRVPAALVAVAAGIGASAFLALDQRGVRLVGEVQGGLPAFGLPDVTLAGSLWHCALGIALMSFVESAAAGRAFVRPGEDRPDPNRELGAVGLANLASGFFHAMPAGGGTSQTAVNSGAGARSQIAGLVTAAAVLGVLLVLAPVVRLMPRATLASVVVVSCLGMIRPREFHAILRVRWMEFTWAVAAFGGVLLLGTLDGIVAAVVLSLLALIYRANIRPVVVLGRKPGTSVFRPLSELHPDDETFPGLLLVKVEGQIHFANAQRIGDAVWQLVHDHRPRVMVLDCSAVPDIEYTALKMLEAGDTLLRREGVVLWVAALNPEPLDVVGRSSLGAELGRERMFFSVEMAVARFHEREAARAVEGATHDLRC